MADQERIQLLEQEVVDLKSEVKGLRRYMAACEPFIVTEAERERQVAESQARLYGV